MAFAEAIVDTAAPPGTPWAIAIPGPFDYEAGVSRHAGVGKFDALNGVPLVGPVRAAVGAESLEIRFLNDAEAFAIGEWYAGAGVRAARCVGVTLGSGIGSAFLREGRRITAGSAVPPDGELHLTRVGGVPVEDLVSRRAILRLYSSRVGGAGTESELDVKDIFDHARSGDAWAADVLTTAFANLGRALDPWLSAFGAESLVVGGGMIGGWDVIEPALATSLAGRVAPRPSADPVTSALVGAAVFMRRHDGSLLT